MIDGGISWTTAFNAWKSRHSAKLAGIRPREDLQEALSVIGRRSNEQRWAEARWQNPDGVAYHFFDKAPAYPQMPIGQHDVLAHANWTERFRVWEERISSYAGYRLDLRNTALRGADLSDLNFAGARLDRAQLQGANLYGTQLHGASLSKAQMQGAYLVKAQMQGAWLHTVQMQGARLSIAQMQGAKFFSAEMQGAEFDAAQMQNAVLKHTQMQGTQLLWTDLSGARLVDVAVNAATELLSCSLLAARLKEIDFGPYPAIAAQIADAFPSLFADATVILPAEVRRPAHWPDWAMEISSFDSEADFDTEYAKWLASPSTYIPPPPPTP